MKMYRHKYILILTIILLVMVAKTSQRNWTKYNRCDPKWKEVKVLTSELKMCDKPISAGLDGSFITVLASALTTYGLTCEGYTCDPNILNILIKKYKRLEELWDNIGIGESNRIADVSSVAVDDYIERGYILLGVRNVAGSHDTFVVDSVDGKGNIKVLLSDGVFISFPIIEVIDLRYFKLKNNIKKNKEL